MRADSFSGVHSAEGSSFRLAGSSFQTLDAIRLAVTADELKRLRQDLRHTQESLAKAIGISRKTINKMENGATIDSRTELALLGLVRPPEMGAARFAVTRPSRRLYAVVKVQRGKASVGAARHPLPLGLFARRDHAYRWCSALQATDHPRPTRQLARSRSMAAQTLPGDEPGFDTDA